MFPYYYLIGSEKDALSLLYREPGSLSLFPRPLRRFIAIDNFVNHVSSLISSERFLQEEYPIEDLVSPFAKKALASADQETCTEIYSWCTYLIEHHLKAPVIDGVIKLDANARESLAEIAYKIVKERGHAISGQEIASIVSDRYPDRLYSTGSVIQSLRLHPEIATIGRSGLFTLKEWDNDENRGGTIRAFVDELLASKTEPIASLIEIETYVKQFRPDTKAISIQNNLLLDSSNKYKLYKKGGERYIGLSSYHFTNEYVPFESNYTPRRSLEESFARLQEFIETNKRFPRSCRPSTDEERRLSRFIDTMRYREKHQNLKPQEKIQWNEFLNKYSSYNTRGKGTSL